MGSVVCGLGMSSHWNLNVRRKCVLFFFACFIFVFVFFPFFPSHVQFVRMGHFEGGGLNWVRGKWHRQKMYPPDLHKYRRPYANTHILPLELHFEYYLLHIDLHFWTTQPTAAQVRVSLVLDSCMMAHLLRTSYGRWMSPYTPFTRFRFSARSWTVNGFCVCWFFFFRFSPFSSVNEERSSWRFFFVWFSCTARLIFSMFGGDDGVETEWADG